MFRFTIRDILWLTVVIALALGWSISWFANRVPFGGVNGMAHVAGKPVADGRILFQTSNGQYYGAKVVNGRFAIQRLPVGEYSVTANGVGVAAKYDNPSSGLKVKVNEGTNAIDLELN
jgi:hypothetical protein